MSYGKGDRVLHPGDVSQTGEMGSRGATWQTARVPPPTVEVRLSEVCKFVHPVFHPTGAAFPLDNRSGMWHFRAQFASSSPVACPDEVTFPVKAFSVDSVYRLALTLRATGNWQFGCPLPACQEVTASPGDGPGSYSEDGAVGAFGSFHVTLYSRLFSQPRLAGRGMPRFIHQKTLRRM